MELKARSNAVRPISLAIMERIVPFNPTPWVDIAVTAPLLHVTQLLQLEIDPEQTVPVDSTSFVQVEDSTP